MLRELGVLLTAIMVAGRTGSAYAAELGVMQLNDEVDALESMGLNPYEVLVLPRVLGLVIALPLLTIVADFMGLARRRRAHALPDRPAWPQFVTRLDEAIGRPRSGRASSRRRCSALLIGLTGTLRGLQVRESSRELGRLTTVAVVQSIFLVIFADALFADASSSRSTSEARPSRQPVIAVRDVVNRFGSQVVHDGVSLRRARAARCSASSAGRAAARPCC